jgi:hypothetical protein
MSHSSDTLSQTLRRLARLQSREETLFGGLIVVKGDLELNIAIDGANADEACVVVLILMVS